MHLLGEIGTNGFNPFAPESACRDYHAVRAHRAQYRRKSVSLRHGLPVKTSTAHDVIVINVQFARPELFRGRFMDRRGSGISLDASYAKLHLNTIGGIAFFAGAPFPSEVTNLDSIYISNIHAVNLGMRFPIMKRADFYIGYNLTKDTGDGRSSLAVQSTPAAQVFYNVQTFPLTYQTPLVRLSVRLHEKLRWNAGYQYYAYQRRIFGVLSQDHYRANTGYTSLLWSF